MNDPLSKENSRSSVNTFACSDVIIQMCPTCVCGVVVTRSPRMSEVRGSNPGTAIGYALLMSSNKRETRVQCFPLVWTHRNNYAQNRNTAVQMSGVAMNNMPIPQNPKNCDYKIPCRWAHIRLLFPHI
ncbi:hypothetical protein T265_02022 [Opisthorchis viverrini]|uniref:Uncharacterized protein n=1 Tax=Opisthorchis viverrini TaxID=6198 RepID=A0A075A7Y1_OPIVI|nr:hypothetical protein T265_02022 [Opisthorchis viverrini]KER31790.1 hypothetical protein T265_02022 [Opisthorchis viverrini]